MHFQLLFFATTGSNISRRASSYQIRIQFKNKYSPFDQMERHSMTLSFIYSDWIASSIGKNQLHFRSNNGDDSRSIGMTLIKSAASAFCMLSISIVINIAIAAVVVCFPVWHCRANCQFSHSLMMTLFVIISDSSQHDHFDEINWFVRAFFLSLFSVIFSPRAGVICIYSQFSLAVPLLNNLWTDDIRINSLIKFIFPLSFGYCRTLCVCTLYIAVFRLFHHIEFSTVKQMPLYDDNKIPERTHVWDVRNI